MGIHGNINEWLKASPAGKAFRSVNAEAFRGTRFAVDAQLLICAKFASSWSEYANAHLTTEDLLTFTTPETRARIRAGVLGFTRRRITEFIGKLVSLGITPVFTFDSESLAVPEKHAFAHVRRAAARAATAERIRAQTAAIAAVSPIFRSAADLAALRKLVKQAPPMSSAEDAAWLRTLVTECGAPIVQAPDEAEKMCALLCQAGICSAAWTTDTDTYLCGGTIMITDFSPFSGAPTTLLAPSATDPSETVTGGRSRFAFQTVHIPEIFEALALTREQFVDFGILLGVDFNDGIPGVGPAKGWALLSAARDANPGAARLIEHIAAAAAGAPPPKRPRISRAGAAADEPAAKRARGALDFSGLNQERCRQIFLDASANKATILALDLPGLRMREGSVPAVAFAARAGGTLAPPAFLPPSSDCDPEVAAAVAAAAAAPAPAVTTAETFEEAAAAAEAADGGFDDLDDAAFGADEVL